MFPGTVTNRGDEPESEAALKKPETGLWNGSCFRVCPVLELVALYCGFDSKRLGLGFTLALFASVGLNEMETGPWLVLLPRVDSIWLSSAIPGLKLEKGLERRLGLVPWIGLELSLLPVLTVDMELWLETGVVGLDIGLRL